MKGSVLIAVAALIGMVSTSALAQQRYIVQLSLDEVAPWYAIGKKDHEIISTTVLGSLGQPVPVVSTTETGYLVDVQTSYSPTSPEYHLELGPVRTGLEALVTASPVDDESERISISLLFSYTAVVDGGEPVVETSTAKGHLQWTGLQGQAKLIPFTVDGKKYSLKVKASLAVEENSELAMNTSSTP